jgi:hypothetical protein
MGFSGSLEFYLSHDQVMMADGKRIFIYQSRVTTSISTNHDPRALTKHEAPIPRLIHLKRARLSQRHREFEVGGETPAPPR